MVLPSISSPAKEQSKKTLFDDDEGEVQPI